MMDALTNADLDLILWMLETACENNPDDEELSDLKAKIELMKGTPCKSESPAAPK